MDEELLSSYSFATQPLSQVRVKLSQALLFNSLFCQFFVVAPVQLVVELALSAGAHLRCGNPVA